MGQWISGEGSMMYFVKRTSQTGVPLPHPVAYARPSAALKYACVAVGSGVKDIWIEDEDGNCIADRTKIERIQRERASNPSDRWIYG
jgi:hypothetical protein